MANNTGNLILSRRKMRAWVQDVVAEKAETTKKHISRIEGGKDLPSREMAVRIATALDISVSEMFAALAADTEGGAGEVTYEADPDSIPIPEGYNDDDPVIRQAATAGAQQAYKSIVQVLRDARKESPGTTGFGKDRYSPKRVEGDSDE